MKTDAIALPPAAPGRWMVRAGAHLYLVVNVAAGVITAYGRYPADSETEDQELGVLVAGAPGDSKVGGAEHMAALVPAATVTARETWPDLVGADWYTS